MSDAAIFLKLDRLNGFGQLAWLTYCARVLDVCELPHELIVHNGDLAAGLNRTLLDHWPRSFPALRLLEGASVSAAPTERFAAMSGSAALSRKLLAQFERVFVYPSELPRMIEPALYWEEVCEPGWRDGMISLLAQSSLAETEADVVRLHALAKAAYPQVTLITSVFDGDQFLEGFLDNAGQLAAYEKQEHLLIRPGSPGQEHEKLLRHIRNHPSAVYINLEADPGLYDVWNFGASIAKGEYLSNANLDDRRSPGHVQRLVGVLECEQVDVASGVLHVTQTPNMAWDPGCGEKRMFSGEEFPNGHYEWTRLFRTRPDGTVASRNLPHCMPVWRRGLHGRHGLFRERNFGPSADWEFWLRCGQGGATFYLLPKPLGLYLKSPQSYWHVASERSNFDDEIVREYFPDSSSRPRLDAEEQLEIESEELRAFSHWGAWFSLFHRLYQLAIRSRKADDEVARLVDHFARESFGISGFTRSIVRHPDTDSFRAVSDRDAFDCALFFLADSDFNHEGTFVVRWQRLLLDYLEIGEQYESLVALGYIRWATGDQDGAWRILREAYKCRNARFWPVLQSLFRFRVPMEELLARLDAKDIIVPQKTFEPQRLNLRYYPNYPDNAYQSSLYRDFKTAGARVEPIEHRHESVDVVEPEPGKDNVLHLHWINAIFKGPDRGRDPKLVAQEFLAKLAALQQRGVHVAWTVHNHLSHEVLDAGIEWSFRRALAEQVDVVYLHHPMIAESLDWLPPSVQPRLIEHGPYGPPDDWRQQRRSARESLGIPGSCKLVVCSGKIKPYKQLEEFLPVLLDWVERTPDARLHVLGEIRTPDVEKILSSVSSEKLLVIDRLVPDDELDAHLLAADVGFLSYTRILTSGSLFHMLSRGLPVIAPRKGSIPAYVVNGWNGWLYDDREDLPALLDYFASMDEARIASMRDNALSTARTLSWDFRLDSVNKGNAVASNERNGSRDDERRFLSARARAGEDMWGYFQHKAATARQREVAQRRLANDLKKGLAKAESRAAELERSIKLVRHDRDQLLAHARYLDRMLSGLRSSTSWALTAPLRWAVLILRRIITGRVARTRIQPFPVLKSVAEKESARTNTHERGDE